MIYDINEFAKERDEAFNSLDKAKIKNVLNKYGFSVPNDDFLFWDTIHTIILVIKTIDPATKEISKKWLASNDFKFKSYFL